MFMPALNNATYPYNAYVVPIIISTYLLHVLYKKIRR